MELRKAVTLAINQWDPVNLLSHAPDDEYSLEIGLVAAAIERGIRSPTDLATEIHQVFCDSFGDDVFRRSLPECATIAGQIIEAVGSSD